MTFQLNPYATDLSEARRCLAYSLTAGATAAFVYTVIFQAIHLLISIAPTVTEVVHEVDQCICACVCVCVRRCGSLCPTMESHRDLTIMWQSCSTWREMTLLRFYIKRTDRIHF